MLRDTTPRCARRQRQPRWMALYGRGPACLAWCHRNGSQSRLTGAQSCSQTSRASLDLCIFQKWILLSFFFFLIILWLLNCLPATSISSFFNGGRNRQKNVHKRLAIIIIICYTYYQVIVTYHIIFVINPFHQLKIYNYIIKQYSQFGNRFMLLSESAPCAN